MTDAVVYLGMVVTDCGKLEYDPVWRINYGKHMVVNVMVLES